MKTSAILHRVADFLKGFPPFCYLDTVVLEQVAASGRVRFHERDEILCSAGDEGDTWLRVIQQGTVRLTRPAAGSPDQVVDLLGAGDIVGLGQLLGHTTCEHTATTLSDTVIYALDFAACARACADSPRATRFLQVHSAAPQIDFVAGDVNTSPLLLGGRIAAATEPSSAATLASRFLVACGPGDSLQAAAALMQQCNLDAVLVVDDARRPIGSVTAATLRDALAAGDPPATTAVARHQRPAPPTVAGTATPAACVLQLAQHGAELLCVTVDGTPATAATAVLTERDLLLWQGLNPTVIVRALHDARSVAELAAVRGRIDALLHAELRGFQKLDGFAALVTEANRVVLRKLLDRAVAATTAALGALAPGDFCLACIGEAGRGEVLTPSALELILILDEPAAAHDAWFAALATTLVADLATCGFAAPASGLSPVNALCRLGLAAWSDAFRTWIASPIEHHILQRLPFFDFAPVEPNHPLAEQLRQVVRAALAAHPAFLRLLVNDCFENLPPLTILEGYAVDADGLQTEELALRDHATQPVADVARVFQLAAGDIAITSTLDRLEQAAQRDPAGRPAFEAAARAFRIVLACRTIVGLRSGSDGARIRPAVLARPAQLVLKSGFQGIAALLDHAARAHGFKR